MGVDPGSRVTGVAILQKDKDSRLEVLSCGIIRLEGINEHIPRLKCLYEKITEYLFSYNPDACAVETPVYGKDPQAMLKLGRIQAAAILAISNQGIPVSEYFPKAIKKSITGNGNASKSQVAYMLDKLLGMPDEKLPDDATDALATAWCHLMKGDDSRYDENENSGSSVNSWGDFARNNPGRIK